MISSRHHMYYTSWLRYDIYGSFTHDVNMMCKWCAYDSSDLLDNLLLMPGRLYSESFFTPRPSPSPPTPRGASSVWHHNEIMPLVLYEIFVTFFQPFWHHCPVCKWCHVWHTRQSYWCHGARIWRHKEHNMMSQSSTAMTSYCNSLWNHIFMSNDIIQHSDNDLIMFIILRP